MAMCEDDNIDLQRKKYNVYEIILSYDFASGSEITPCNKVHKPLVVYRCSGNVMKSIITLRTNDKIILFLRQK